MEYKTLFIANVKRHKGGLLGVLALMLIACLALCVALAVFINGDSYVRAEMERLGFGDITAWVAKLPDSALLTDQLLAQAAVDKAQAQPLIYAGYSLNEKESDSEGQLLAYQPKAYPYRLFTDSQRDYQTSPSPLAQGEIYLSPSMLSLFNAKVGEEIRFSIARSGGEKTFIIKGFFEDPFMGSSMVGMKSFLISPQDFSEISQTIAEAGIDGLARTGAMIHIFQSEENTLSLAQWNKQLNETTDLSLYTEFVHSKNAILDYMLLLQRIFAGFLLVFVVALLVVSLLILGHSISSTLQRDASNMGILKSLGFTSQMLQRLVLLEYLAAMVVAMVAALVLALPILSMVSPMTLSTTGILAPSVLPLGLCITAFVAILCALSGFIVLKTGKIGKIRPLQAILGEEATALAPSLRLPIYQKNLSLWLALRQLSYGKRHYLSALLVALLLVFLGSMVGRVHAWLGPEGKGLMEAFNPADHDIGVQRFGQLSWEALEESIAAYSDITDRYLLAMPSVTVNGIDYIANVIDQPQRFHILKGRSCTADNEVVLTETAAADLNVAVGGHVSVAGLDFVVSGIYQCANNMGANLGMNREGYLKIGEDSESLWCTHYFLADPSQKTSILQALTETYGGDVHSHENAWAGLTGIVHAMGVLMGVLYAIIGVVILIVITLVSGKLLATQRRNLAIYKALGCTSAALRTGFALRFALVSLLGALLGLLSSGWLTDPLVSLAMKQMGISNFASGPSLWALLLPPLVVTLLFALFGFWASRSISKVPLSSLAQE